MTSHLTPQQVERLIFLLLWIVCVVMTFLVWRQPLVRDLAGVATLITAILTVVLFASRNV